MAGFAQFGEGNTRISPPLISNPVQASGGYVPFSLEGQPSRPAGFYQKSTKQYAPGADTSGQHQANVYMKQMGFGDNLSDYSATLPNYGLNAQDWANVNRYLSNPQNQQNVDSYMDITNRMKNQASGNPYFNLWSPEQVNQFTTDFPLRLAAGYNLVPPPVLQAWGIPVPSMPGMRF